MDRSPSGPSDGGDSPGKDTGVGCHALLQGIFSTQRSNPGLKHCKQILYHWATRGCINLFELVFFFFFLINTQSSVARLYGSSIFNFLRNLHTIFHNGYTNLHSHQVHEGSLFSTYLPILIFSCLFYNSHSVILWFWFAFSLILGVLNIFSCIVGYMYVLYGNCLFRSSAHF